MGRGREWEICLNKNNLSRDDDVVGGEIKTPITFVISEVSMENISGGPRCHFVDDFGREIRREGTTKYTQVLIGEGNSVEGKVWVGHADHLGGGAVQQICGGVEPFLPSSEPE
jgi:hypothetical protein